LKQRNIGGEDSAYTMQDCRVMRFRTGWRMKANLGRLGLLKPFGIAFKGYKL